MPRLTRRISLRMSERKVPMRRCVGCMTSFPKGEVTRFVAADGKIVLDKGGKMNGRGVYLCKSQECFDAAIRKKRLTYALGATMTQEECAVLRKEHEYEISKTEVFE